MSSSPRSLILLVLLESAGGLVLWGAPDDLRPSQPVRSEVSPKKVHWAFVTPQAVSVPAVTNEAAVRNPVDRFILSRLEQEGVAPAPEANRVTWLRRVHLDLTGLPPTPDETTRFLADLRPDAYERRVDELLASPHYGERWARWWLDVARYADSNGYSIDAPRSIWPWRDWVIRAFNEDLPYDQFLIEQLAGDLLPNATPAQHVATGFHRNTQINEEGGIDREQFRIESVMDRVNTTGTAFWGITIGCAQCHDHKFDPLTQRDYFQLYAFFNQQEEPNFEVIGQTASASELHSQLREAEAEFDRYFGTVGGALANWEKALTSETRTALPTAARTALETLNPQRTRAQKRIIFTASNLQDSGYRQREQRLADLEAGRNAWVSTLAPQTDSPTHRDLSDLPASLHRTSGIGFGRPPQSVAGSAKPIAFGRRGDPGCRAGGEWQTGIANRWTERFSAAAGRGDGPRAVAARMELGDGGRSLSAWVIYLVVAGQATSGLGRF